MIFDPPPKSRRRVVVRLLWPTLIAGVLIVAAVVSAAGEETRTELTYMDEMRAEATNLSRSGARITDVMSRLVEVDREEFTTVFEGVTADLDAAQSFVADEPPTKALIPVWALYRQSVNAWAEGVSGLASSILQAADDPDDETAVNLVGDSLALLRAGDNLFQDLQLEFDRTEIPDPVGPLADVILSPTEASLYSQSISYVAAARRSTNELGLRPGLKVSQVLSDPAWQINVEGEAVVPSTETIVFSTVITNSGNIASEAESVSMTLSSGAEPIVATVEIVPPLQPDGQTTITFPEVEVLPDTPYEIDVSLEVSNPDSDMTDNQRVVEFTVNAE